MSEIIKRITFIVEVILYSSVGVTLIASIINLITNKF